MAVSGQVVVKFDLQQTNVLDLATGTFPLAFTTAFTFTDGAGANSINQIWSDTRTLTASSTEDLDLSGTALQNAFGTNIAFARVKAIYVKAASGNTNNVLVGGAAAAQFANWTSAVNDVLVVRPGGAFLLVAPDATGYAVTATTADLLMIANSAGSTSVTYDIAILGATS